MRKYDMGVENLNKQLQDVLNPEGHGNPSMTGAMWCSDRR